MVDVINKTLDKLTVKEILWLGALLNFTFPSPRPNKPVLLELIQPAIDDATAREIGLPKFPAILPVVNTNSPRTTPEAPAALS
jgi:hypothetical protein